MVIDIKLNKISLLKRALVREPSAGSYVNVNKYNVRFSPNQRIIAWRLAEDRPVHVNELVHALYGHCEDGGVEDPYLDIRQYIFHMKRKITPYGLSIGPSDNDHPRFRMYHLIGSVDKFRDILAFDIWMHAN